MGIFRKPSNFRKVKTTFSDNPINAVQKVEDFVGIDHYLVASNFKKQKDTGMFCMQLEKEGVCRIPGGHKGRTVHKSVPEITQKQLRRFFRAVEGDNQILDKTFGTDVYPFSWSKDLLNY